MFCLIIYLWDLNWHSIENMILHSSWAARLGVVYNVEHNNMFNDDVMLQWSFIRWEFLLYACACSRHRESGGVCRFHMFSISNFHRNNTRAFSQHNKRKIMKCGKFYSSSLLNPPLCLCVEFADWEGKWTFSKFLINFA